MPIEAGSVSVRLGARFEDKDQFDKYDREVEKARAKKAVTAELGGDFKPEAFRAYERALAQTEARTSRRQAFKAQLGADYDPRGVRAYESALRSVERRTSVEAKLKANPTEALRDLAKVERKIADVHREINDPARVDVDTGLAEASSSCSNGRPARRATRSPSRSSAWVEVVVGSASAPSPASAPQQPRQGLASRY